MPPKDSQDPPEMTEAQLLEEIAKLEKEAAEKKAAAETAIQNATKALEEADTATNEMANKANKLSVGAIDAIAQMIAVAEQEAEAITTTATTTTTTTTRQEEESRESCDSPPAIVRQDPQAALLQADSNDLGMQDPTESRHFDTMETTLDTLMTKIEECTAVLSNPNATVQEHITAAQLAKEYAKAAKAFHNALE